MPSVYLETSVISYLAARPSRDIVIAGHQQTTRDWWQTRRQDFLLYISELVLQEARRGDRQAAQERLTILEALELLAINPEAMILSEQLIAAAALPGKAAADALHIAIAVTSGIDYLLTWNCKHIANAVTQRQIEAVCRNLGYEPTTICTPEQLMEES